MKRRILLLVLCFGWFCLRAQLHYPDESWPVGTREFSGQAGYGTAWIRFENGQPTVMPADLGLDFEATVAVGSDTDGHLLFYSNGCEISNADGTLMSNGDGLNPGELHDWVCATGYTVPRGMMALPLPGSNTKWMLLHTGGRYDPIKKLGYGPFYYSEITMTGNQGIVVTKNIVLSDGELEPFAVVRHANGRDWWVVIPEYNSNRYQIRLLGPAGFSTAVIQEIGPAIGCRRIGSSVFSNDGSRYARTNNCSAVVMDFDRCSGVFSHPVALLRPAQTLGGGGVVFSGNNRWLYATSNLSIFRADLNSSAPFLDSLFKLPYLEGESAYVHSTSLACMQTGPDGKVYIGSQHRERFLNGLIMEGDTFQYLHETLVFPVPNVRTLPHFPNFRLFDISGSGCDSLGINAPVSALESLAQDFVFDVHPNPASEEVTIRWRFPENKTLVMLGLYDLHGRLVRRSDVLYREGAQEFALRNLPKGIYIVQLQTTNLIITRKLVVE